MTCFSEGTLRAYLDGETTSLEHAAIAAHLSACPSCRAQLEAVAEQSRSVATLLMPPTDDPQAALARFKQDTIAQRPVIHHSRRSTMNPITSLRINRWASSIAALVVIVGLLALPPVRAAADQLLSAFRIQNVIFLPVSQERMQQLQALDFDGSTLFTSEPQRISPETPPVEVGSVAEAANLLGFTPAEIRNLPAPATSSVITVNSEATIEAQVNVEAARQLLRMMNITDVTLPDALGSAPISVAVDKTVIMQSAGDGYHFTLIQGKSPTVTMPDGVDLTQLGTAMLRLLGMEPAQAEAFSRQIDWSSTLLFPFVQDLQDMRTVNINGVQGLLVTGHNNNGNQEYQLYWQQGERFFLLQGYGVGQETTFISTAESVR